MGDSLVRNSGTGRDAIRLLWYWVPPLAYAGLIFHLSSLSHPEETLPAFLSELGDTVLHMTEYGVLGILCYRGFRHAAGQWAAQYALLLATVVAAIYGITDEVHQAFVPFRESDARDWLADAAGAALAVWSWHSILRDR